MKRAARRPRVAILGCGNVGRALAVELLACTERGGVRRLFVWSRRPRTVARLRELIAELDRQKVRRLVQLRKLIDVWDHADVVLLAVADDAQAAVARELAACSGDLRGRSVFTTNGYLPLQILASLRRRGCAVARLHPLAPVPRGREGMALYSAYYGLEGDARARLKARLLVRMLRGRPLDLATRRGAARRYHAAASLLGGGLVALYGLAEQVMGPSVRSRRAMRDALDEFARAVLWNLWNLGPEKALTGAIARGSEALVRGHLQALARVPDAALLYRWLGGPMLELALARGTVSPRRAQRLGRLLARAEVRTRLRAGRMLLSR